MKTGGGTVAQHTVIFLGIFLNILSELSAGDANDNDNENDNDIAGNSLSRAQALPGSCSASVPEVPFMAKIQFAFDLCILRQICTPA